MRYLDLNFDLQPLPSLGEDTEYNRSLHFVLCVNNTVRHKKNIFGHNFLDTNKITSQKSLNISSSDLRLRGVSGGGRGLAHS